MHFIVGIILVMALLSFMRPHRFFGPFHRGFMGHRGGFFGGPRGGGMGRGPGHGGPGGPGMGAPGVPVIG